MHLTLLIILIAGWANAQVDPAQIHSTAKQLVAIAHQSMTQQISSLTSDDNKKMISQIRIIESEFSKETQMILKSRGEQYLQYSNDTKIMARSTLQEIANHYLQIVKADASIAGSSNLLKRYIFTCDPL